MWSSSSHLGVTLNICLLTIGDELLEGVIRNTNAEWFCTELWSKGLPAAAHVSLPDDAEVIASMLSGLCERFDLCVLCGGLGPTTDDVTAEALGLMADTNLVPDNVQQARLTELGLTFERASLQARRPETATAHENKVGYAPLLSMHYKTCRVVALPGVPREFKSGVEMLVLPFLQRSTSCHAQTLSFLNLGESRLSAAVEAAQLDPKVEVRYQAAPPFTHLRLRSDNASPMEIAIDRLTTALQPHWIPHTGDALLRKLAARAEAASLWIATAESCTSGMIGAALGRLPGASGFLIGGVIAYSNEVKQHNLGVTKTTLERHGAVSEACAAEMAEGVCRTFRADVGLSVTGIAGPGGGSKDKPVGTVCFGWCVNGQTRTETINFRGNRTSIREASAVWSLNRCLELLSARVP